MSEFEFTTQINTSFINPALDKQEIELVAIYDYSPNEKGAFEDGLQISPDVEESIEITDIKAKFVNKFDSAIADYVWESGCFDHLIEDIFYSRNAR